MAAQANVKYAMGKDGVLHEVIPRDRSMGKMRPRQKPEMEEKAPYEMVVHKEPQRGDSLVVGGKPGETKGSLNYLAIQKLWLEPESGEIAEIKKAIGLPGIADFFVKKALEEHETTPRWLCVRVLKELAKDGADLSPHLNSLFSLMKGSDMQQSVGQLLEIMLCSELSGKRTLEAILEKVEMELSFARCAGELMRGALRNGSESDMELFTRKLLEMLEKKMEGSRGYVVLEGAIVSRAKELTAASFPEVLDERVSTTGFLQDPLTETSLKNAN